MISLRFHIVSIVAVFLGIAVGVVVGSTFVSRAVVDNLERRVETVSRNLDERRDQLKDLRDEQQRSEEFVTRNADFAVTDRLTDAPVLVMGVRGIDEDTVDRTTELARHAGATVPGALWIEPKWASDDAKTSDELGELLADDPRDPDARRAAILAAVADELTAGTAPSKGGSTGTTSTIGGPNGGPTGTTPTTIPKPADTPVLDGLVEHGFLTFESVGDQKLDLGQVAGRQPRILLMTGTDAEADLHDLTTELIGNLVDVGAPTVVADVFVDKDGGPRRGADVEALVEDGPPPALAVVDNADQTQGRVASVLAIAALADGTTGHFGFGVGADALLPAWSPS